MALRAGIEDPVVHDHRVHAALRQRIALHITRVEVADDRDVRGVVMEQRSLRVFAFAVGRMGQAFRDDAVGQGDVVGGVLPPFLDGLAFEALAGGGEVLIDGPRAGAVVEDHVRGRDGDQPIRLPAALLGMARLAGSNAQVLHDRRRASGC